MEKIDLSVIIPCYNEERNIRLGALENVAHFLNKKKISWEAILVDDESTDESVRLVEKFIQEHSKFKIIKKHHQGKAAAVTNGIFASGGEIILFTDLDQATPINQLDLLLPWFNKGYDVVIGSRNSVRKGAPFLRLAMARGFMFLRNLILNLGINDTQCGFKAFKRRAAVDIFSKLKVYNSKRKAHGSTVTAGFDVELLYIAKELGYKIKEIPVEWHYQETRHVNPLKDSFESLVDLIRIWMNSLKGIYSHK
ncbi:MAG: glycosyl transferase family 2 [uncultured bacterium]|nr:MAG: glycosyl transferase family 2 [uncultured bacterium]